LRDGRNYSSWKNSVLHIVELTGTIRRTSQTNDRFMLGLSKNSHNDKQGAELEIMSDTVQAHLNHLKLAITEQNYYHEQCKMAANDYTILTDDHALLSQNKPCSFDGVAHYSWDYAQQTHYPQQLGLCPANPLSP